MLIMVYGEGADGNGDTKGGWRDALSISAGLLPPAIINEFPIVILSYDTYDFS